MSRSRGQYAAEDEDVVVDPDDNNLMELVETQLAGAEPSSIISKPNSFGQSLEALIIADAQASIPRARAARVPRAKPSPVEREARDVHTNKFSWAGPDGANTFRLIVMRHVAELETKYEKRRVLDSMTLHYCGNFWMWSSGKLTVSPASQLILRLFRWLAENSWVTEVVDRCVHGGADTWFAFIERGEISQRIQLIKPAAELLADVPPSAGDRTGPRGRRPAVAKKGKLAAPSARHPQFVNVELFRQLAKAAVSSLGLSVTQYCEESGIRSSNWYSWARADITLSPQAVFIILLYRDLHRRDILSDEMIACFDMSREHLDAYYRVNEAIAPEARTPNAANVITAQEKAREPVRAIPRKIWRAVHGMAMPHVPASLADELEDAPVPAAAPLPVPSELDGNGDLNLNEMLPVADDSTTSAAAAATLASVPSASSAVAAENVTQHLAILIQNGVPIRSLHGSLAWLEGGEDLMRRSVQSAVPAAAAASGVSEHDLLHPVGVDMTLYSKWLGSQQTCMPDDDMILRLFLLLERHNVKPPAVEDVVDGGSEALRQAAAYAAVDLDNPNARAMESMGDIDLAPKTTAKKRRRRTSMRAREMDDADTEPEEEDYEVRGGRSSAAPEASPEELPMHGQLLSEDGLRQDDVFTETVHVSAPALTVSRSRRRSAGRSRAVQAVISAQEDDDAYHDDDDEDFTPSSSGYGGGRGSRGRRGSYGGRPRKVARRSFVPQEPTDIIQEADAELMAPVVPAAADVDADADLADPLPAPAGAGQQVYWQPTAADDAAHYAAPAAATSWPAQYAQPQ